MISAVDLIQSASDIGNVLLRRRARAKKIAAKNRLSARRLEAHQQQKNPSQRSTIVREEIKDWCVQEINDLLELEKSQFKAMEEESKLLNTGEIENNVDFEERP